jgi:hypothetical protein
MIFNITLTVSIPRLRGIDLPTTKFIVLGAIVMVIGYVLANTIFYNGMIIMGSADINGVPLVPTYQIPGILILIIGVAIVAFAFYKKKPETPASN